MKSKALKLTSVLCAGVMTAGLLAGCSGGKDDKTFVSLDINPSVELILDANDRVVSVYGTNEDGQVLLYGETSAILGKDVDTAIEFITASAVELGYLDEDNKVVELSASSTVGSRKSDKVLEKIDAKLTATADSLGITVSAESTGAYSLLRKLDAFKAEHPEDEDIQKMTAAEFRLALSATEAGGITLEAAVELDDDELVQYIAEARKDIAEFATAAYNAAKSEAFRLYDSVAQTAIDSVYSVYYTKNLLDHTDTAYYGGAYQMYALGARGFDAIADAAEYAGVLASTPLDEAQIAKVMIALGLEETEIEKIKDGNGNITIESIEAYADVLFKNSEANAELEKMKTELTAALNETESKIKAEIERLSTEYAEEAEAIAASVNATVAAVKATVALLPDSVQEATEKAIATAVRVMEEMEKIAENGLTVEDLRGYAAELRGEADRILELIKEDLSEEEYAELEEMKAEAEAKFADARAKMEETIAKAEESARNYLQALKNERKAGAQA